MRSLMDIMKSSMTSLYESLLDDEEELLNKPDLNIFDIISKSRSKDEFYEKINILKDLCIAVDINDDLSKYKNSFFLIQLISSNNNDCGIKIDRYFKKNKQSLFINCFKSGDLIISKMNKHTFHELKYKYYPGLKSDTVYVLPKDIEKQYVEWVAGLPGKYLNFAEKSKVI